MRKNDLRQHFKKVRDAYVKDHGDHAQDFLSSFNHYASEQKLDLSGKIMALYYPFGAEASPLSIINELLGEGVDVALPKMRNDHIIFVRHTVRTTLVRNHVGFFEPEPLDSVMPDIMIMPLLAFDDAGHRLGYGKGHYDQAIAALSKRKPLQLIGLAYPCQHTQSLPFEAHDKKLDAVLLPNTYIQFSKA